MTVGRSLVVLVVCSCAALGVMSAQENDTATTVTGTVSVSGANRRPDPGDVAIWLKPTGDPARSPVPGDNPKARLRILQQNKRFNPHMLVVRVGSVVDFPNADPFFHNVFSMYDGKRFDLGLYEAGASRSVTFARPGICYIFCNIHPDMSAVVLVVDTPYYALSAGTGEFAIRDVPAGRYVLSVWHERYALATAGEFPREVTISDTNRSLGVIRLVDNGKVIGPHQNKFGHDYVAPSPASPVYK